MCQIVPKQCRITKAYSIFCLSAAFAVLLASTSCASLAHDPKETYVLITANVNLPYWQTALAGLNHAAAEMQVRAEMDGPDTYDPKAEYEAFQNAVQRKPAGILIWAVDAALMTPGINAAVAQGIPVATLNADAPDSNRLFMIGTNNYKVGALAGRLTNEFLKGKGEAVIFRTPSPTNARDRLQGFQDAIAGHPGIHIAQVVDVKGEPTLAFDTTKRLIDTKTSVSAFVCFSASAGPEVGEVVSRENLAGKVAVIALDADPRTLELIQKGAITASIAQKPFTMGYFGLKALDNVHHDPPIPFNGNWARNSFSPLPTFIDTGTFIIDKKNVNAVLHEEASKTQ
jgi:ribose transport system substrate-binding protein